MNTKKQISLAVALVFSVASFTYAQSGTTPVGQVGGNGTVQQLPQFTQGPTPSYYNLQLTDEQKAEPGIGATFYDAGNGISVRSVYANGPAQKAGINSGDFINKVNGQAVQSVGFFNDVVSKMKAGDTVQLTKVDRAGKETEVSCQVMTFADILTASTVPEAGAFDNAVTQATQMLQSLEQQIKNTEAELADMKKRYAAQQTQLAEMTEKAEAARAKAEQMRAAEAEKAEAMKQQAAEQMEKPSEEMEKPAEGSSSAAEGSAPKN